MAKLICRSEGGLKRQISCAAAATAVLLMLLLLRLLVLLVAASAAVDHENDDDDNAGEQEGQLTVQLWAADKVLDDLATPYE